MNTVTAEILDNTNVRIILIYIERDFQLNIVSINNYVFCQYYKQSVYKLLIVKRFNWSEIKFSIYQKLITPRALDKRSVPSRQKQNIFFLQSIRTFFSLGNFRFIFFPSYVFFFPSDISKSHCNPKTRIDQLRTAYNMFSNLLKKKKKSWLKN